MHRVDTSTAAPALPANDPAGTPGYFTKGNPGTGTLATVPGQDWFNAVQEELAYIVIQAGLTLSKADRTQLYQAVAAMIAAGAFVHLTGAETIAGIKTFSDLLNLSSGQLQFPASQNASANANTLDDYEEGTWTPTTNGGTATFTIQIGTYTKIGRMVYAKAHLKINLINTDLGAYIYGFPFTAATDNNGASVAVGYFNGLGLSVSELTGLMAPASNFMQFYTVAAGGAVSVSNPGNVLVNGTEVIINAAYNV